LNPFNVIKYLPHLLRKKIYEKYIIIESDDWGLERAPNVDCVSFIEKKFGKKNLTRWSYDTLETKEDLNYLYDLLESYKNKFESPPVITANFITHNIDYSNKEELKFLPISKGFSNKDEDVRELYKKGIEEKYIFPQLHGFSHYNIEDLKNYFKTEEANELFSWKFLTAKSTVRGNMSFLQGELGKNHVGKYFKRAAEEFERVFGFNSKTFIPPTYIYDFTLTDILKANNIGLVQSSNRLNPASEKNFLRPYFKKRKGLYWSVRNARLDPHPDYNFNHEQCLSTIQKMFEIKSPAIIDFHRVNFAGRFAPDYRNKTLEELKKLFEGIHKKWPDVKFIHSQKFNDLLWQQEIR